MTRYVTRAVRMWVAKQEEQAKTTMSSGNSREGRQQAVSLKISESRKALDIVPQDPK